MLYSQELHVEPLGLSKKLMWFSKSRTHGICGWYEMSVESVLWLQTAVETCQSAGKEQELIRSQLTVTASVVRNGVHQFLGDRRQRKLLWKWPYEVGSALTDKFCFEKLKTEGYLSVRDPKIIAFIFLRKGRLVEQWSRSNRPSKRLLHLAWETGRQLCLVKQHKK